jgi:uncharacterized protein YndB with AHSA1/START domain
MAMSERFMPVPPEAVWDALADAHGFGYWVVGSSEIREIEGRWPEPGSRFHHTVGIRPLRVRDHTESLEARRPALLRIRAKARPLGSAEVTMTLTPLGGGTRVRMAEEPDGRVAWLAFNPLLELLLKGRNAESLMRLEELALLRAGQSPS